MSLFISLEATVIEFLVVLVSVALFSQTVGNMFSRPIGLHYPTTVLALRREFAMRNSNSML